MKKTARHTVLEVRTISLHQSYHGWATLERIGPTDLAVVVSAGRERHVCPFGQVHLLRSRDNGQTWEPPVVLANGPLDDRDAGILRTSNGTLLVNWFTSAAWLRRLESAEAKGPKSLSELGDGFVARCQKMRLFMTPDLIARELGTWMIRSTDGGQTWSPKYDCGVGSPHGPTELAGGRLLFVGNWKAPSGEEGRNGSPYSPALGAMVSDDDGRTWQRGGAIPQRPGDPLGSYHEPHAVQAPDGRILVHIRNHSDQDRHCILQCESLDGGHSFSVPRNTGLLGLPAHLRVLRDGRILTTYGYRVVPYGNRASLSEDGGRTWSEPMILDEKPQPRDLGYPTTVELDDGTLLTVWYECLPGATLATLSLCRWRLRD